MLFDRKHLSDEKLLDLYRALLKPRMIEERMLTLLRQGRISKWFSGIGQEAISVGATEAMAAKEFIFPMHRNLGVFTSRGVPLERLFAQFQGKPLGFTKGRDRSFHFGIMPHHIVGMISHLGPQLSLADGVAMAHLMDKDQRVTLAFTGDGATSEGEFHEALNVAAVWQLPVIFLIEHNGYGLSTPDREQFRCERLADKAKGYGMEGITLDGNNLLEVYHTILSLRERMQEQPQPFLIEAMTFRMRGHEEASGTKYVPQALMDQWAEKDPIKHYEGYLVGLGLLGPDRVEEYRQALLTEINAALELAFDAPTPSSTPHEELADVYCPTTVETIAPTGSTTDKRLVDAISDGLRQSMDRHPNLILMGQDIADYGGVFKVTQGFMEQFGRERVRNTPLCESAIIGAALGLSLAGYKAMVEIQFADFVTCGFNQIVNNLAKLYYRWGQHADVVIRMPTGAGVAAGPFHSQSNEAWFFHTPGLKVVYPSNPADAKGLLNSSLTDPNPVIYFEHKALYRSSAQPVADAYFTTPLGKARLHRDGDHVSVITYGMGVHWAAEAAKSLGVSADIVDLRTLLPWDKEAVRASVRKTGKVLVCHEDCLTGGIAAEIAAWIGEHCFGLLDAPVMREGSLDTPVPFAPSLEAQFLPKERISQKLKQLADY